MCSCVASHANLDKTHNSTPFTLAQKQTPKAAVLLSSNWCRVCAQKDAGNRSNRSSNSSSSSCMHCSHRPPDFSIAAFPVTNTQMSCTCYACPPTPQHLCRYARIAMLPKCHFTSTAACASTHTSQPQQSNQHQNQPHQKSAHLKHSLCGIASTPAPCDMEDAPAAAHRPMASGIHAAIAPWLDPEQLNWKCTLNSLWVCASQRLLPLVVFLQHPRNAARWHTACAFSMCCACAHFLSRLCAVHVYTSLHSILLQAQLYQRQRLTIKRRQCADTANMCSACMHISVRLQLAFCVLPASCCTL